MPGSRLQLPPLKRRRHGRRYRKWAAELNSATIAAVFGGPESLFADPAGSLSVGLVGSSESAVVASALSGNLVKNCVEFCNLG